VGGAWTCKIGSLKATKILFHKAWNQSQSERKTESNLQVYNIYLSTLYKPLYMVWLSRR
jgi:hypothetical protein